MQITHRSSVTDDQIDHLGHMNVRYYGRNARKASTVLLAILCDAAGVVDRPGLRITDIYTRHHREQMLGTDLEVRSGVVGASSERLALYHELANAKTGELAAAFVHILTAPEGRDNSASEDSTGGIGEPLVRYATARIVPIPEQGAARSISLDRDRLASAPSYAEVSQRGLAMRRPRPVRADECDAQGRLNVEMAPMLVWDGEPAEGRTRDFVYAGPNGEQMGWATMENRLMVRRLPAVDDKVESFGASLEIADKITRTVHWSFDAHRHDLLVTFEVVNLAFDIGARRSMSIPDDIRAQELAHYHPDLD